MKRKKIIPLVSIVILIVFIVVGGTTLFIFKTRDKENNVSKNEKTQIIEKTNETLSEDEISGLLDTDEYLILKSKYKDDSEKLENRAAKIKEGLKLINDKKAILKTKETIYGKYKHIDCIDIDIVSDFIDRIYIGKYNKETNTRDMKIVWNFES